VLSLIPGSNTVTRYVIVAGGRATSSGGCDAGYAWEFMRDVASRLDGRVRVTTDGHGAT
jgi:hypothetical protein